MTYEEFIKRAFITKDTSEIKEIASMNWFIRKVFADKMILVTVGCKMRDKDYYITRFMPYFKIEDQKEQIIEMFLSITNIIKNLNKDRGYFIKWKKLYVDKVPYYLFDSFKDKSIAEVSQIELERRIYSCSASGETILIVNIEDYYSYFLSKGRVICEKNFNTIMEALFGKDSLRITERFRNESRDGEIVRFNLKYQN